MDDEQPLRGRRGLIALVAMGLVSALLALALGLGATAIRRDWLVGPSFSLHLGSYYVLAETTGRPECLPLPLQQCFITFPIPHTPTSRFYVIWAGTVTRMPGVAPDGVVTISSGRRVLQLEILR